MSERPFAFGLAALLLALAVLGFAGRQLDRPGLYYDEVIQATPASEFLREGGRPLEVPGARNTRLFGGWFPLMTQPYMSALKSQLLIPSFALFGASTESLRATTLVWGCLGLVLCMLWIRAVWGAPTALLAGLLLAADPSFLFVTRHDWGSVSLALVLRGGGLGLLVRGWRGAGWQSFAGGLLLGLGVTNKIDAGVFLAAAGLALAVSAPALVRDALGTRRRAAGLACAGALLGVLPMLVGAADVLRAASGMAGSAAGRSSDFAEKLDAWRWLFDGSYFDRLMQSGGRFDALAGAPEVGGTLLGIVLVAAIGVALWRGFAGGSEHPRHADRFAVLALLLSVAGLLLVPRAARIHHVMNVFPLPQLVIAIAAVGLWQRGGAARLAGGAACAALLASLVAMDLRTFDHIEASGGRGRWSDALASREATWPDDRVLVSLDWGFHGPLVLLAPERRLEEPAWKLLDARGAKLRGAARHVYLTQAEGYEVLPSGPAFLRAVAALPPERVEIETVTDRSGDAVFHAVRILAPHTLHYDGDFEVRFR